MREKKEKTKTPAGVTTVVKEEPKRMIPPGDTGVEPFAEWSFVVTDNSNTYNNSSNT